MQSVFCSGKQHVLFAQLSSSGSLVWRNWLSLMDLTGKGQVSLGAAIAGPGRSLKGKGKGSGKSGGFCMDLRTQSPEGVKVQPPLSQTVHSICPVQGQGIDCQGNCCSSVHSGCFCRCHLVKALQRMPLQQISASLQVQVDFICDCRRSVAVQVESWMVLSERDVITIASVGAHTGVNSSGATNGMSSAAKRRRRRKMLALANLLKQKK